MYCPNCGTKNNYYHRFCFLCGTRLTEEDSDEATETKNGIESATDDSLQIDDFENDEEEEKNEENAEEEESAEDISEENEYLEESNDKDEKIDEDEFFSELAKPTFDFDLSYMDLGDDGPLDDFEELNDKMPLRRYHRDSDKGRPQRLIKTSIAIVLIALVGLLAILASGIFNSKDGPSSKALDFNYDIEDIMLEGEEGKKITFLSKDAQMIAVSGDHLTQEQIDLPVTNGSAELTLLNSDFIINDYDIVDSEIKVSLNILVKADDYDDQYEKIDFDVAVVYAPLTIIQPSGGEVFIEGDTYQLIIKVDPNSQVFIDDNSYSHLIDEEGNLDVLLEVPDLSEVTYNIKVISSDYEDNERVVTFKREMMDFLLMIDQEVPVEATEEWVEITGFTDPKAELKSDRDLRDDPEIDPETGAFTIYARAIRKGYTPLTLTASIEGMEDSRLEIVIDWLIDESAYIRSAWAPDAYDELKAYENMHTGQAFLFEGAVESMDSTGSKSTLMINTGTESDKKLLYVEYWGTGTFTLGQDVRLYGNRWGYKDEIPRILARYINSN